MVVDFLDIFLNKSIVVALITISLGAFWGLKIYKKQKKIDQQYKYKEKLAEKLILLKDQCESVNFVIDRLANTFEFVKNSNESEKKSQIKIFKESISYETDYLAKIFHTDIPTNKSKIESIVTLYFGKDQDLKDMLEEMLSELKKWHDFFSLKNITSGKFPAYKKVKDVPEISLEELNRKIKKLINYIKDKK